MQSHRKRICPPRGQIFWESLGIMTERELSVSTSHTLSPHVEIFITHTYRSADALMQWVADKTEPHLVSWTGTSGRKSLRFVNASQICS